VIEHSADDFRHQFTNKVERIRSSTTMHRTSTPNAKCQNQWHSSNQLRQNLLKATHAYETILARSRANLLRQAASYVVSNSHRQYVLSLELNWDVERPSSGVGPDWEAWEEWMAGWRSSFGRALQRTGAVWI